MPGTSNNWYDHTLMTISQIHVYLITNLKNQVKGIT